MSLQTGALESACVHEATYHFDPTYQNDIIFGYKQNCLEEINGAGGPC